LQEGCSTYTGSKPAAPAASETQSARKQVPSKYCMRYRSFHIFLPGAKRGEQRSEQRGELSHLQAFRRHPDGILTASTATQLESNTRPVSKATALSIKGSAKIGHIKANDQM
jgi:hypothetical protein